MSIIGIEAVTFGVKNIAKSKSFLTDWGLKLQKSGSYGADYACVDGSEIKIRLNNNQSLPPPIQAGSTVREVTWGVKNKIDLRVIAGMDHSLLWMTLVWVLNLLFLNLKP